MQQELIYSINEEQEHTYALLFVIRLLNTDPQEISISQGISSLERKYAHPREKLFPGEKCITRQIYLQEIMNFQERLGVESVVNREPYLAWLFCYAYLFHAIKIIVSNQDSWKQTWGKFLDHFVAISEMTIWIKSPVLGLPY